MKNNTFRNPTLIAILISLLSFAACSHEVSHTETDKPNWSGGRTQEETTVYKNADGTTSTEHSKQTSQ